MPGPTTEGLNEDIKGLREDIKGLHGEIHRIDKDVALLGNKVGGIITTMKLLCVLVLTSLGGSIWWGATLTADVKNLNVRMDEKFKVMNEKMDDKFKAVNARLDSLEASIAKILEQTRPKP